MLQDKSIEEILSSIKKKDLSVKEVIEHYLTQIKKFNPILNAIVSMKDEQNIIDEAIKMDNSKDKKGSLFGMPIAIKDLSDVENFPTTYGYINSKNNFPKKNSLFVNRLIGNGVIIIGKTNTAELGVGGHTTNRLFGPTSNVFDVSKSAAGSSGGASSAVSAGLIPFADGTDQMGSCRGPAAYANIYGFRPTPGLISTDRSGQHNSLPILTTPGCIAKTPNDLSILLDAMTGSDSKDKFSFDLNGSFKNSKLDDQNFSNIKIGWLEDVNSRYTFESGILEICEKKLKDIESFTKVESVKSKINTSDLWESWITLRSKSIYYDTINMNIKDTSEMTAQAIWEFEKGSKINEENIKKAINQKLSCLNQVNKIFEEYDFLALPSAQVYPFDKKLQYPEYINGEKLDTYHRWLEVFILSSLLELPTITVPVGFNKNGLPMGMQIIARKKDDLKLIAFVKKYEEIFKFSKIKHKLN